MEKLPYIPDQNIVSISGSIITDPQVRYVGSDGLELCEFVISTSRKPSKSAESDEPITDVFNVIIKGDGAEAWSQQLREGLHVRIHGLFQSRPYRRSIPDRALTEIAEIFIMGNLDRHAPVARPEHDRLQPLDWKKLLDSGLLSEVPADDESEGGNFRYMCTPTGEVLKESRHIRYEILVGSIEVIDPPEDGVDENRIVLVGKIKFVPRISYVTEQQVPLCQFAVVAERPNGLTDLIHCIRWGADAERIAQEIGPGERVKVSGRLQSRAYEKEIKVGTGKKRRKKTIQRLAYEVSVAKLLPVAEKPASPSPDADAKDTTDEDSRD